MNYQQNLHTHSTFCDGKDTPEEMVLTAMEKGYHSIGFSGHSYIPGSPFSMSEEKTAAYKAEIGRLKEAYAGKIDIFCGLEYDSASPCSLEGYDYLIGTVHYIETAAGLIPFDRSREVMQGIFDAHFGGDAMAFARQYYRRLAQLPELGSFDILGHFDIFTKHIETMAFLDQNDPAYRSMAIEAAEALAGKIPFFEVNTGAISRGYRSTPYPHPFIIRELKRLGFRAVITSDCHDRSHLDCFREEAKQLLKACGFQEHWVLKPDQWVAQPL